MAIKSKNIFLFFSRPSASFSYIITIYISTKSQKIGFWAVLGPLGPNPGKPDFSGKFRLGQLSSNIVPQLQAKNQENR